jgi:mRNA interferase RelE/StbE
MDRITIQWTEIAKGALAKLPPKVRRGLLEKASELRGVEDPAAVNKPLVGLLAGYHRICYSRYRAIYTVERVKLADKTFEVQIKVLFVAAGVRKEGDKNDVYRLAQRLVKLGIIRPK